MEDNQEFIPPTDATAVESAVEYVQFIPPTDATAVEEITDPDVKKKEQTKPTQAAPLPGLGGVSEEPTPSPSVGQGVLRNVDQTQPRGEAFISRASDLTRTDVREPQVDGEELPTGPTGPTGAIGAMQPQEFEGIAVTPTGAAIDLGEQYREE